MNAALSDETSTSLYVDDSFDALWTLG